MMDLVTLVTACALGVEPKLMHALIWHQSGGEPWAVSVKVSQTRSSIRACRTQSGRRVQAPPEPVQSVSV